MHFALSTEQLDFAAALRDQLANRGVRRAARAWGAGDYEPGRRVLRQLADSGVFALGIAEEHGGLGAGVTDQLVAMIEMGRGAVAGPIVESAVFVPALLAGIEWAPATGWLSRLAEGTLATATHCPDIPRLLDAEVADLIVATRGDTIRQASAGAAFTSMDAARRLSTAVPGELIATAPQAIENAHRRARLAVAAQLLGAGQAVVALARDYACNRVQFGKPIGGFQAVKHQLASAHVGLEMAQPVLWGAALAIESDSPTAARDVAAAKLVCGDAAYYASRVALQVHGAIGYTAEYNLALWLTKIRALVGAWGAPGVLRAQVGAALWDDATVPVGGVR